LGRLDVKATCNPDVFAREPQHRRTDLKGQHPKECVIAMPRVAMCTRWGAWRSASRHDIGR
jgi:hypothetical protein